jgi:hypothetical protein
VVCEWRAGVVERENWVAKLKLPKKPEHGLRTERAALDAGGWTTTAYSAADALIGQASPTLITNFGARWVARRKAPTR